MITWLKKASSWRCYKNSTFWQICCQTLGAWTVNLYSVCPLSLAHFVAAPDFSRSQLSFFSLWWIWPGCLGYGPHDGAWDGWPSPWCWLPSWWAARSGACPGPHGWASSRWQQSVGLVWYWPVNHPLGKKFKKASLGKILLLCLQNFKKTWLVGWEWLRPICKSATKTDTYFERRCLWTLECS